MFKDRGSAAATNIQGVGNKKKGGGRYEAKKEIRG